VKLGFRFQPTKSEGYRGIRTPGIHFGSKPASCRRGNRGWGPKSDELSRPCYVTGLDTLSLKAGQRPSSIQGGHVQ